MWLTNRKKPLRKSLTISFTKGWPRFGTTYTWRADLHDPISAAIALTGLTWSFSWYRTDFYRIFGIEANTGRNGGSHTAEGNFTRGRNGRKDRPDSLHTHSTGQEKSTHVRSVVYTIHAGSRGVMFTRTVNFLTALPGATLPLTGYYLWIRRLLNKVRHGH